MKLFDYKLTDAARFVQRHQTAINITVFTIVSIQMVAGVESTSGKEEFLKFACTAFGGDKLVKVMTNPLYAISTVTNSPLCASFLNHLLPCCAKFWDSGSFDPQECQPVSHMYDHMSASDIAACSNYLSSP